MPVDVKNLPAYGSVKRCGGCAGIRYPHSITPTYREGAANKAWMAITCKACMRKHLTQRQERANGTNHQTTNH
jgi:hypothetical protein